MPCATHVILAPLRVKSAPDGPAATSVCRAKPGEFQDVQLSNGNRPKKSENIFAPDRFVLRVTKGLQYDRFENKIRDVFFRERFKVSQRSNRMGLRTEGPEIKAGITDDILTEGLPIGAVQVPGNGHPIITFVDHQTTGGYPKIANVIAADLCKVGQLKPGDEFKFQLVSLAEAEKLYFEQESFFKKITHL